VKALPAEFPGAAFQPIYTDEFLRRLDHRRYREQQPRVAAVVERICRSPFHLSHLLDIRHGLDWRGKRDRHVAGDLPGQCHHLPQPRIAQGPVRPRVAAAGRARSRGAPSPGWASAWCCRCW